MDKKTVSLFLVLVFCTLTANSQQRLSLYHTMEESYEMIQSFSEVAPDIVRLDTIGYSQQMHYPIIAVKISDHPDIDEDEPCVMFDGLHHAREPIGMEVCLQLIEHLVAGYGVDDQITSWINTTEIWVIPMMNPEGWKYIVDENLGSPYWRKNLRDNDQNGVFNPEKDGVDINRNYDFNWVLGGSGNIDSWTYRGPEAFSESEARAKQTLALREKPIISLSYHTHGEIVIYSWSENPPPPDQDLILNMATEVASRIPSSINNSNTYRPTASNCQNGFSRCWMYTVVGSIEFTVECAKEFIPDGQLGLEIAQSNLNGAKYVLDRVHGSGLQIYVKDQSTLNPVIATIKILELPEGVLTPRKTDSLFGRHDRLLLPGDYTVEVSAMGYESAVENIRISDGQKTIVEKSLVPTSTGLYDHYLSQGSSLNNVQVYPNPVANQLNLEFDLLEETTARVSLLDLSGREIDVLLNLTLPPGHHKIQKETRARSSLLKPGMYILLLETNDNRFSTRLILQ